MTTPTGPQVSAEPRNRLGLTAMAASIIGFVLACNARSLEVGWVLLAIAFILGVAGLLRSGTSKKTSTVAVVISIVGAVVSAAVVVFGVTQFIVGGVWDLLRHIFIDSGRP